MADEDVAVPMTREFVYRQLLVGIEMGIKDGSIIFSTKAELAESLTNHLVNNALQLQVAEAAKRGER